MPYRKEGSRTLSGQPVGGTRSTPEMGEKGKTTEDNR